tara:strand:+ start:60 stop:776 length:717 start_codon:yes stop_codon:yes gene_type:complete
MIKKVLHLNTVSKEVIMGNVLIIEDDIQLNLVVSEYFKLKGFNTLSIYDGMEAIEAIDNLCNTNISLYVVDINLPNYNGIDILKYIRQTDLQTPIIIITASLEIENFIEAFDNGCSEYIKKPFHIKELEIRVNKLLDNEYKSIYFTAELYFNVNRKTLFFKDKEIELRNKERRFIEILVQNRNKVVPVEVVCDYIWEGEIKENYPIRQLLADLRKKLPLDIIKTKIRQGYMVEVQNEK